MHRLLLTAVAALALAASGCSAPSAETSSADGAGDRAAARARGRRKGRHRVPRSEIRGRGQKTLLVATAEEIPPGTQAEALDLRRYPARPGPAQQRRGRLRPLPAGGRRFLLRSYETDESTALTGIGPAPYRENDYEFTTWNSRNRSAGRLRPRRLRRRGRGAQRRRTAAIRRLRRIRRPRPFRATAPCRRKRRQG